MLRKIFCREEKYVFAFFPSWKRAFNTRCFLKTVKQTTTGKNKRRRKDKRLNLSTVLPIILSDSRDTSRCIRSCTPIIRVVIAFSAHSSRLRGGGCAACAAVFLFSEMFRLQPLASSIHESRTTSRIKNDLDSNAALNRFNQRSNLLSLSLDRNRVLSHFDSSDIKV